MNYLPPLQRPDRRMNRRYSDGLRCLRLGWALCAVLTVAYWCVAPASAFAALEQVGTFADDSGEVQLNGSRGLAVNVSGAGGVPSGTLYSVGRGGSSAGVTQYGANGKAVSHWGAFLGEGIAVHQPTGNLYVLEERNTGNQIEVYSADGAELLSSFGELAGPGETVAAGPGKIHAVQAGGIAVNSAGEVYVADVPAKNTERRVMVFKPKSPGDFSSYEYAGQQRDIAVGKGGNELAIDASGNLYLNAEFQVAIEEYDPSEGTQTPICRYETPGRIGGILGMTVNPTSGELFYFSQKDKKFHQLSACNEGKFVQTGEFTGTEVPGSPKPVQIEAMAFNPSLAWTEARPPGVLYAADEELHSGHGQGYIFAQPEVLSPLVEDEYVSAVTAASATFNGEINSNGSPTRFVVQYLTDAAYQSNEPSDRFAGALEVPLGGGAVGSGSSSVAVAAPALGLLAGTTYHYRLIATSNCEPSAPEDVCESVGSDQTFETAAAGLPVLPDNRAYELVSPAEKYGGEVFPLNPGASSCAIECKPGTGASERFPMQSALSGDSVAYQGFSFSPTEGSAVLNAYISKRSPSGWQTTNPTPAPFVADEDSGYKAFDPQLGTGLLYQIRPPILAPGAPPGFADLYSQPTANPSGLSPLLVNAPPNRPEGLSYKLNYAGASTDLARVFFAANDALTEATPSAPPAPLVSASENNLYEWAGGELRLVNVLPGNTEAKPNSVFGSGKQLAEGGGGGANDFSNAVSNDGSRVFWSSASGQVYVREDGELTEEVPDHTGKFLTASADGSRLLLSDGNLYDVTNLAAAPADLSAGTGGFQGIVGQSEDLSSIYFVDTAALTPEGEENANGEHSEAGKNNLYSWQEGTTAFIAALEVEDDRNWRAAPIRRTAQASPDGRWVAFVSTAQLTGFDNTGPCGTKGASAPCQEAYLFDSTTGTLSCPSCSPSGARPLGRAVLPVVGLAAGTLTLPQPRYLLENGRLFFDTRDSLSPLDTNGSVEDVYEYEPQGLGTCTQEGGCTSLISAGREPIDSNFLAADPTAKNVFFTTRDKLVSRDTDELIDLYDAREFGGFPAESESVPPGCCQLPPPPPSEPAPTSSAPQEGNVKPPKACPKGKVRNKKGNCVKKQTKKPKRHHKKSQDKRAANDKRGGAK